MVGLFLVTLWPRRRRTGELKGWRVTRHHGRVGAMARSCYRACAIAVAGGDRSVWRASIKTLVAAGNRDWVIPAILRTLPDSISEDAKMRSAEG